MPENRLRCQWSFVTIMLRTCKHLWQKNVRSTKTARRPASGRAKISPMRQLLNDRNAEKSGLPRPLLLRWLPRRIGVINRHLPRQFIRVRPEVFLIDFSLLIDNEGHHSGVAPFGWPRNQPKTGDHVAVDDVSVLSARRVRPLLREDLKTIALKRCLVGRHDFGTTDIPFAPRLRDPRPQRAGFLALIRLPIQSIVPARSAPQQLRVLENPIPVPIRAGVFPLRRHIRVTHPDGVQR